MIIALASRTALVIENPTTRQPDYDNDNDNEKLDSSVTMARPQAI
jgi:hypothetical protein